MLRVGVCLRLAAATCATVGYSASCSEEQAQAVEAKESHSLRAFSPKEFRSFPISRIERIAPNTKLIELALPSPQHEMV
ncbi:hypothetical protein EON63_17360 [archaeon]|nr:MAG: hypothetical protein EON63_17360 [archaeon]